MSGESDSPFQVPRNLLWFFIAGLVLAAVGVDFLLHQQNPFERGVGGVRRVVAVLYVEPAGGSAAAQGLAAALDSLLPGALARANLDSVVPAPTLRGLRAANGLRPAGPLSPREALMLAGLAAASRFVVGTVEISGDHPRASLQLLATSSGHRMASAVAEGGPGISSSALAESLAARLYRERP